MLNALIITTLAGLATALGGAVAVLRRPGPRFMAGAMGFAAGVMLSISLLDLIPEALEGYATAFTPLGAGLCAISLLLMGMVAAGLLEGCLPERPKGSAQTQQQAQVLRSALITGFALLLHNLPEGMLTLFATLADPHLGLRLAVAVGLHNLPEGVAVAAPVYFATGKRGRAMGAAVVSGLAEPVGAVLAYCFLGRFFTPGFLNGLLLLVAGIMVWVSLFELLPTGFAFGKRGFTAGGFCLGLFVMILGIALFS